jgi:L,D-transpeptidase ErfK/SrfK
MIENDRTHRPLASRALRRDRRAFCSGLAAALALAGCRTTGAPMTLMQALPDEAPADAPGFGRMAVRASAHEDTLLDLARENGLGYTEIVAANPGIDPWLPGRGTRVVLPKAHLLPDAPREGLVLNLADQRLYRFGPDGRLLDTAPIGIGSEGRGTPTGTTRVRAKRTDPTWYVPRSIRRERPELPAVVPPGPDNPLGRHALYLDWPAYLIHGTNEPWGIGRRVSAGCIRLYPEDVARLYPEVAVGTAVRVVDQPVKLGRWEGALLLEVHPDQGQADALEKTGSFTPSLPPGLEQRVAEAAGDERERVDWARVEQAGLERRGYPVAVLAPEGEEGGGGLFARLGLV